MQNPPKDLAGRIRHALKLDLLPPAVRRIVVGVVGGTLLIFGLLLVITPGPAFVVVPVALAILATEFVWAKRYLRKGKVILKGAKNSLFGKSAN